MKKEFTSKKSEESTSEVYVLVSTYIDTDSGDFRQEVIGVYKDSQKAKKTLRSEIKDTKACFKGCFYHCDYTTKSKTDEIDHSIVWSIYDKSQPENHFCELKLAKRDIKE